MTRKPMARMTTPKRSDGFMLRQIETILSSKAIVNHSITPSFPCHDSRNTGTSRSFGSTDAPDDAGLVQVIRGHLHLHAVTDGEAHEPLAHFAGNGRQHLMFVVQFDAEHCP